MGIYKNTPGVQIEEIAKLPPSIAEVETAIPAFIGQTYRTDIATGPVRITSLQEYEIYFGRDAAVISVEVNPATDRDGNPTYAATVSVDPNGVRTMYYQMQLYFANGGGPCYIISTGSVMGGDASRYITGLNTAGLIDEPTLLVFPDIEETNRYEVYRAALDQCGRLKDRFVIMDCEDPYALRDSVYGDNLKYGAAYYPFLQTSLNYVYDEDLVTITGVMIEDGASLTSLNTSNNILYHIVRKAIDDQYLTLPPSAAIAGVYARVDSTRGVWKAPANVSLNLVRGLTDNVNDAAQEDYNVNIATGKSINIIRRFTGKGILVWGARTLDGNSRDWRYIAVRRFFNMVEESTKNAVSAFVFEPNDTPTWLRVQGMIENYLTILWRAGALQGAKPADAFYVNVGLGKTMTVQDVLEGRMYIEIGMAVVRPAEFIVLNFSHVMSNSF